jgi:hypothetical protein
MRDRYVEEIPREKDATRKTNEKIVESIRLTIRDNVWSVHAIIPLLDVLEANRLFGTGVSKELLDQWKEKLDSATLGPRYRKPHEVVSKKQEKDKANKPKNNYQSGGRQRSSSVGANNSNNHSNNQASQRIPDALWATLSKDQKALARKKKQ